MIKKSGSWTRRFKISQQCLNQIQWWADNIQKLMGIQIVKFTHQWVLTTDASTTGWGAVLRKPVKNKCPGEKVAEVCGPWRNAHESKDMCLLESIAVVKATKHFRKKFKNKNVLLKADNIGTIFYVNMLGG